MRPVIVLRRTAAGLAAVLVSCTVPSEQAETAPADWEVLGPAALSSSHDRINFSRHVKPVLEAKCVVCHNHKDQPWFSMEDREAVFAQGATGPRVVPGDPEKSVLIFKGTKSHAGTMPAVGNRLTENEKRILTAWVQQGAEWPKGSAGHLQAASGETH